MAGAFEIDEAGFPLVVATVRGQVTSEVISAYFARLDAWCLDGRRYASILNITRIEMPSAAERKQIVEAIADRHTALARSCIGVAIVVTNPLIRGAVTAILWMQHLPHPLELVATEVAAKAICATWLGTGPASRR